MPRLRVKSILTKAVLLSMSFALALLVAELALRVGGVAYPLPYAADPHCGTRLQPDFEGLFTREGRAYVVTNSDGHRDREHTKNKPANTFRIAVLGDSFAEAFHVSMDQTFWFVMEQRLQQCDAFKRETVEVLNFGVSGYGTAQQLQMLRHYVWQYEPDLVLLAFLPGNDVRDNSRDLRRDGTRPYFTIEQGQLKLDDSFKQNPAYRKAQSSWTKAKVGLINRSRLLQLVAEVRARSGHGPAAAELASAASNERGLDQTIYTQPESPAWRDAWEVTDRLIVAMSREVRAKGADFWVATLSNGIQVHPDAQVSGKYARDLGVDDLFYAERRVASLADREGFAVVQLAPAMQSYAQRQKVFLHGFENTEMGTGHWNAEGHRFAGETIAKAICQAASRN